MVGPTEALPSAAGAPPKTGWQLAQRVWEDSGVTWEVPPAPVTPAQAASSDPYHDPAPHTAQWYGTDWYPSDPRPTRPDIPVQDLAPDPAGSEPASSVPPLPKRQSPPPQAPPLPRRIRRASDGWNAAPPLPSPVPVPSSAAPSSRVPPDPARSSPFAPSAFAPASPFAPSPAFASSGGYGSSREHGEPQGFASPPLSAPVPPAPPLSAPVATAPPPGEPDELFREWQGSVKQAAGRRSPRTVRRPALGRDVRFRGCGWQVAKIGVPAAVIVTVGAGALLMLTGRANDMLAERASSGALSAGKPTSGPVASGQTSVGPSSAARVSSLALAGYPAEDGTVGVAALWSAGGATVAVGYADGHPAVWRHAADGTWSLVSTAVLGAVTGHLTSVAQGPSGWVAVGSVNGNGTAEPAVFGSADGVNWQQLTTLTAAAGRSAQFLGVAAGPGGYLVVGRQATGNATSAALWWSSDLRNWVNGENNAPPGSSAAAAAATADGFVAVGSENNSHTFWTSADGQHWTAHDLAKPSGASTATLTSVTAGQGGQADRFVAAGVATTSAGDLPIVVTAANDGTHISQTVLSSSPTSGPASVTAVTATANGFVAVGAAGPANALHAVTWTSVEGRIWTPAAPLAAAGTSEVTALAATTSPKAGTTLTATAQRGATPTLLTIPLARS